MTGLEFLQEVQRSYDRGVDAYAKSWPTPTPWLQEARERFAALLPTRGSVLDVGAGPGHESAFFHQLGFRTVGIDISDKMLEVARRAYPDLCFIKCSVLDLSSLDQSFDGIWCGYSLLHVPAEKWPDCVANLRYALKGSALCVATGISTDEESREVISTIAGLRDSSGLDLMVPSVRFSPSELRAQLGTLFCESWYQVSAPLAGRRTYVGIWQPR